MFASCEKAYNVRQYIQEHHRIFSHSRKYKRGVLVSESIFTFDTTTTPEREHREKVYALKTSFLYAKIREAEQEIKKLSKRKSKGSSKAIKKLDSAIVNYHCQRRHLEADYFYHAEISFEADFVWISRDDLIGFDEVLISRLILFLHIFFKSFFWPERRKNNIKTYWEIIEKNNNQ